MSIYSNENVLKEYEYYEDIVHGQNFFKHTNIGTIISSNKNKTVLDLPNNDKSEKRQQQKKQKQVIINTKNITNNISFEEISKQIEKLIEENNKLKKRIHYLEVDRDYKTYKEMYNLILDLNTRINKHALRLLFLETKITSISIFFKKLFGKDKKDKK